MYEQLIQAQADAAEIACGQMSPSRLKILNERFDEACRLPAEAGWDRKAAAHAAFLHVLAKAADDPAVVRELISGAGLAYDLMMRVGRTADRIVIHSRRRVLESLRAGDTEAAALELGDHLRILHVMYRLAGGESRRNL